VLPGTVSIAEILPLNIVNKVNSLTAFVQLGLNRFTIDLFITLFGHNTFNSVASVLPEKPCVVGLTFDSLLLAFA
jgi:hypothetical protein